MTGRRRGEWSSRRRTTLNSRTKRRDDGTSDDIPEVYQEMLQDESLNTPPPVTRPLKRRRVENHTGNSSQEGNGRAVVTSQSKSPTLASPVPPEIVQTAFDSDDSDGEDFEWEDVNLEPSFAFDAPTVEEEDIPENEPKAISIVINGHQSKVSPRRKARKPLTNHEKKLRLEIHKLHLLCLLYHCSIRNHWCNNHQLQQSLRKMVAIPVQIVAKLHPKSALNQQLRSSKMFKEGLEAVTRAWYNTFKITEYGMQRPHWSGSTNPVTHWRNTESFIDVREFIQKAKTGEGSADYGAQLFCALLRGFGIEARLVCSLQVMPFATVATVHSSAPAPGKTTIYADRDELDGHEQVETLTTSPVSLSNRHRRIGRLGQQNNTQQTTISQEYTAVSHRPHRNIGRPRHPIFWAEAFDMAYQKWVPIDPIANQSVGKVSSFEPALNDSTNLLSYAIAFEQSGVAKDVTRRYTKAYIAKTRKVRVEVTDKGDRWFVKAMRMFRRQKPLDRDQLEEAQLLQREISEGMPKNIEDFKGHPIYVLERHLYRDEVIHPKRQVGRINAGPKSATKIEYVYRRDNVHTVKSADKWFRLGRQIKMGEGPMKRVPARKARATSVQDDENGNEATEVGLYAITQTEVFVPPAVVNGRVPKNQYGNIDVYVRSMIPLGSVHVKSKYARQAARIIRADFADAVTGFKFQGRHGTAVVQGVVVADEYREAMVAVLNGLAYEREIEFKERQRDQALYLWRRFYSGLEILQRVDQYRKPGEKMEDDDEDEAEDIQSMLNQQLEDYHARNGMLDQDHIEVVEPLPLPNKPRKSPTDSVQTERRDETNSEYSTQDKELDEMEVDALFQEDIAKAQEISVKSLVKDKIDDYVADQSQNGNQSPWEEGSLMSEDPDDLDAEPDWI